MGSTSDIKDRLRSFVQGKQHKQQYGQNNWERQGGGVGEYEAEEVEKEYQLTEEYYNRLRKSKPRSGGSYDIIPQFFFKSKSIVEDNSIQVKLKQEARTLFLQRKTKEKLKGPDLEYMWKILQDNLSGDPKDEAINYEDFKTAAMQMQPNCQAFFKSRIFFKFHCDSQGRINVSQLFGFVMKRVSNLQGRLSLSLYDPYGSGYLREGDLESYILELIPTLPQLAKLEESFYNFYVCTASRKFFFFLDPSRTGKVKIKDIVESNLLSELFELRDEDLADDYEVSNWFSASSVLRVYSQYLNLDKDQNGLLCKEELSNYGRGTLTGAFMNQVFQECHTYDGEMDYKGYLDFVLAMEYRKTKPALQYLFKVLDFNHYGYLHVYTLFYYFKEIQEYRRKLGQEYVAFEDVKDEIFDMVRPKDPLKITCDDLVKSGNGETVVSILIDSYGFWAYDNRESMIPSHESDEGDGGPVGGAEVMHRVGDMEGPDDLDQGDEGNHFHHEASALQARTAEEYMKAGEEDEDDEVDNDDIVQLEI
eukprot:Nk52_evm33s2496 gene=Nk52_evmTU33s2496